MKPLYLPVLLLTIIVGLLLLSACGSEPKTTADTNTAPDTTAITQVEPEVVEIETEEPVKGGTQEKKEKKPIAVSVKEEYKGTWVKDTKPEPLFTDARLETLLNELSKLKAKEKDAKALEIQKDFANPMEEGMVKGKFTDAKKPAYNINEYTRRLAMNEDVRVKVVKTTRNDQNRIIALEVEETEIE